MSGGRFAIVLAEWLDAAAAARPPFALAGLLQS